MDLQSLSRIQKVDARGSKDEFNLRYMENQEKFDFSDVAFDKLGISNHAIDFHISPDGEVAISTMPDNIGKGTKKKDRKNSENKTNTFTARKLRSYLDSTGMEGVNEFALIPHDESIQHRDDEGNPTYVERFYEIVEWDHEEDPLMNVDFLEGSATNSEDTSETEEVTEEEPAMTAEAVPAGETVEETTEITAEEDDEFDTDSPFE